jgi:hypothetical protein
MPAMPKAVTSSVIAGRFRSFAASTTIQAACPLTRHCEVRSNPVYMHGLLHCVRNDERCYSYRHYKELRGTKQSNLSEWSETTSCLAKTGRGGGRVHRHIPGSPVMSTPAAISVIARHEAIHASIDPCKEDRWGRLLRASSYPRFACNVDPRNDLRHSECREVIHASTEDSIDPRKENGWGRLLRASSYPRFACNIDPRSHLRHSEARSNPCEYGGWHRLSQRRRVGEAAACIVISPVHL